MTPLWTQTDRRQMPDRRRSALSPAELHRRIEQKFTAIEDDRRRQSRRTAERSERRHNG
jgi:hypothetical protein